MARSPFLFTNPHAERLNSLFVETTRRPLDVAAHVEGLRSTVERNKTRRRRDGDPPAAQPAPVEPRKGGGLSGGAAAAACDEPDARDLV